MPGFKAHAAGGSIVSGLVLGAAVLTGKLSPQPAPILLLFVTGVFFALFPDADMNSVSGRIFYRTVVVADLAFLADGRYEWAAWLGFFAMLPCVGRHRGWTHSIWAMFLIPLLPLSIVKHTISETLLLPFYITALSGYASHLVLDKMPVKKTIR